MTAPDWTLAALFAAFVAACILDRLTNGRCRPRS